MAALRTALITGASRGIGASIAQRLAKDGFAVAINYSHSAQEANQLVQSITQNGGKALAVQANVGNSADVKRMFDQVLQQYGRLDVLVNNAGTKKEAMMGRMEDADVDLMIDTNFKGTFYGLREASKHLQRQGSIINISASFHTPVPKYGVYAATKVAVEKLSEFAAKELGHKGITVNCIRPGPTKTKLFLKDKTEPLLNALAKASALGRLGEPEDVARVVAFLVGEEGRWINGQVIGVNGGYW